MGGLEKLCILELLFRKHGKRRHCLAQTPCRDLGVKSDIEIHRSAAGGEGWLQGPEKEIARGYLKGKEMLSNVA